MTEAKTDETTTLADGAKQHLETAQQMADDAVNAAKSEAKARAHAVKSRAAAEVAELAGSLRAAAGNARPGSVPAKGFARAAEELDHATRAIETAEFQETVSAARDFARRNPLVFLAGAGIAGFALGRFMRASEQQREDYRPVQSAAAEDGAVSLRTY